MSRQVLIGPSAQDGEIYVPVARLLHTVKPGTTLKDLENLPYLLGGRAKKPSQPFVVRGADGVATLIPGFGETEVAELQELAQGAVERHRERIKRSQGRLITEEMRARLGMVPLAEYDGAFRQALRDRVRRHQQNPTSDPARQPGYQGRQLY